MHKQYKHVYILIICVYIHMCVCVCVYIYIINMQKITKEQKGRAIVSYVCVTKMMYKMKV